MSCVERKRERKRKRETEREKDRKERGSNRKGATERET